jgi:hypothetical protein
MKMVLLPFLLVHIAVSAPAQTPGRWRSEWTDESRTVELTVHGTLEFTDDFRDLRSLGPDGSAMLSERRNGGPERRIEYSTAGDGTVRRRYWLAGEQRPFDNDARAWAGELLIELAREEGLDASQRVPLLLKEGGVPAVLNAIRAIRSDGGRRAYLVEVLGRPGLSAAESATTIRQVGRLIRSDGTRATLLTFALAKTSLAVPGLDTAFLESVDAIASDGDRRTVLMAMLGTSRLQPPSLIRWCASVARIASDGDKAALLVAAAPTGLFDSADGRQAFFDAVATIKSDGDHARVLLAVLSLHSENAAATTDVIRSARGITSDSDKARVLQQAAAGF